MAVIISNQNAKGEHESIAIKGTEEEIEKIIDYVKHMHDKPVVNDGNDNNDKVDMVNDPPHYKHGMECIDEMLLVFGKEAVMNFCLCNCWKYRKRAPYKGNTEEDMEKSRWYLNKYKELKDSTTITSTITSTPTTPTTQLTYYDKNALRTLDRANDYPFADNVTC